MSMNKSSHKPIGGEAEKAPVEHYDSHDIIILTPDGPPTHTRGVCILQTPTIGQSSAPRFQDEVMEFGASAMGDQKDQLTLLKDMLKPTIVLTPDGLSYHGGVQIPRKHWALIDGRPSLLFDQMKSGQMPKFEDMSMCELADWRLGICIQTPEAGVLFNRAFNLKRTQEGFSHFDYPVPFTRNMSDDVDEMILSLEYDTEFIKRCISLAEDAAAHNRANLVPSLSTLHGVNLRNTSQHSSTSSNAGRKAITRTGLQNPSSVNQKCSKSSVGNSRLDRCYAQSKPQTPQNPQKREAPRSPDRRLRKRQRACDGTQQQALFD